MVSCERRFLRNVSSISEHRSPARNTDDIQHNTLRTKCHAVAATINSFSAPPHRFRRGESMTPRALVELVNLIYYILYLVSL